MNALKFIIPAYIILFIFYGTRNFKGFLLLTGIVTLPFRTDYGLVLLENRGWTSGIIISLSDISFILLFLYLTVTKRAFKVPRSVLTPTIAFVLACALSALNSTWLKMTFFQIILIVQIAFLYYFVLVNSIESQKELRLVVLFFIISLLFQGIIGNLQYATGYTLDFSSTGKGVKELEALSYGTLNVRRAAGTVLSPNGFAGFIVPLLLLSTAILWGAKIYRKITLFAVILGGLALLFSFSRGGWVSFIISLLFLQAIMIKRRITSPGIIIIAILAIFVAFSFDPDIKTRIYGDDRNALGSRFPLNEIALNMFKDHPIIGVGGNTFRSVIHSYTYSIDLPWIYLDVVHNQYLLVFAECGLLGLITFLWLLFAFFRESWGCAKNKENRFVQALGIGITAGFLSLAVHGMADFYVASHLGLSSTFLMCAVCSAAKRFSSLDRHQFAETSTKDNI